METMADSESADSVLDMSNLDLWVDTAENDNENEFTRVFVNYSTLHTTTIDHDVVDFDEKLCCTSIKQTSSLLSPPIGGLAFNADPILAENDVIVVMGVSCRVMFPTNFEWNQGGYLPGLHGLYNNTGSSSALAKSVFECRWKWDLRGKFSISTRSCSDDPNEWITTADIRKPITKGEWYTLNLVGHVDGEVRATLNGVEVYRSSCPTGFERIQGVKVSLSSLDNTSIEDRTIYIKSLSIFAKIDRGSMN